MKFTLCMGRDGRVLRIYSGHQLPTEGHGFAHFAEFRLLQARIETQLAKLSPFLEKHPIRNNAEGVRVVADAIQRALPEM